LLCELKNHFFKSKMRIALLTDGIYPYVMGGMQKHSYFLVKFFAQNAVFVDLYHLNQSQQDIHALSCFSEEEKKYITSYVFEFPKAGKLPGHYAKESYLYSSLLYEEFIKHPQPDFIYAKGYVGMRFMEEKKKGVSLPPIGVRLHGYEIYQPTQSLKVKIWNKIYKNIVEFNNKNADFVYSYGGKITDLITKNLQIAKAQIIEIPTGIESKWINPAPQLPQGQIKFVFLGRYDIRKGIKELNTALNQLINENVHFRFEFIGPIPEPKQLKHPSIIYHGPIHDQDKIKELLQQMDVLVVPSHSEGMPNVIMEGMASGCAIIATDVGAINLMVSPKNGILIQPMDSSALVNAIKTMVAMDKEDLFQIKLASIQRTQEEFLWEHVILQEIDAIKKIL